MNCRITINGLIAVGMLLAVSPTYGQANDISLLVNQLIEPQDRAGVSQALQDIQARLRDQDAGIRVSTQAVLVDRLVATDNAAAINKLSIAAMAGPSLGMIQVLADKLVSQKPEATRLAACNALQRLLDGRPAVDASLTERVLERLDAIVQDKQAPSRLVDAGLLAAASFGPAGFDYLVKLRGNRRLDDDRELDLFCTAISQTGDSRAAPILRQVVEDPVTHDGLRIQAIHALGQLYIACHRSGMGIAMAEYSACVTVLRRYLADDTPGQLFSVTLRTLRRMASIEQDAQIGNVLALALSSSDADRREAALDALYQSDIRWGAGLKDIVHSLAVNDPVAAVRSTAEAVLDRMEADGGS